jgi:hypothetical protein
LHFEQDLGHAISQFFLEILKLLRVASFLNTAAMCYLYVGIVLRDEAGGSRNKMLIAPTSQNLILPIMPLIVTFWSSPYFILSIMPLIITVK